MNPSRRSIAWTGFLGSVALGLMPLGCSGAQPTIRQLVTSDHPAVPQITAERLQQCVKEYGHQLEDGSYGFTPKVKVDQDGYIVDVHAGDIPNTAPDLAACTRETMRSMAIPGWIFNLPQRQAVASTHEPTLVQRTQFGSPAVVVVVLVEVALAEIVLEAGAFTILFATTVQLVDKAVDDVAELVKRRRNKAWDECLDRYEACVAGKRYSEEGKHIGDTRCGLCVGICRTTGKWPAFVDLGPCI